jgi:Sec-independent protein translocase protein TatA
VKRIILIVILVIAPALLPACGPKRGEVTQVEKKAFDQAQPELQQMWAVALEAGRTNDYFGAQTLLWKLKRQELTDAQRQALDNQMKGLNERLSAALDKGDPAAQAALRQLRENPPNR